MAKMSDSQVPSLLLTETAAASIGTPAAGKARLFRDTDNLLYMKDEAGVSTAVGGSGGAGADGWVSAAALTYSSADSPTFVATTTGDQRANIGVGDRIKLTQTTAKYFIVTAIDATTVTLYGGTDYTLANAAITSPFYSHMKTPVGFPASPAKWTVEMSSTANDAQATPTQNTWYNLGSRTISIPIGVWGVSYWACGQANDTAAASWTCQITLSTANNTESDVDFTTLLNITMPASNALLMSVGKDKVLTLAAKTSYFLNARTTQTGQDNIAIRGDLAKTFVRAVCAYL